MILPASEIAWSTDLTPAAVTALIDRLERRGYVERRRNESDRRKVLVVPTQAAQATLLGYYGPTADEGDAFLGRFSDAGLDAILRFIEGALAVQQRYMERTGSKSADPPSGLDKARR